MFGAVLEVGVVVPKLAVGDSNTVTDLTWEHTMSTTVKGTRVDCTSKLYPARPKIAVLISTASSSVPMANASRKDGFVMDIMIV